MCNAKRMQAETWRPAGFRSSAACSPVGETAVLTLLVSVAIAVVGIIVVFFVLSLVSLDKSIAGTAATAIIGGIPYLRDSLDKSGLLRAHRTVVRRLWVATAKTDSERDSDPLPGNEYIV